MAQTKTRKGPVRKTRQPPPRGRPYYDPDRGRMRILPPEGGKAVDYLERGEGRRFEARKALRRAGVRTVDRADRFAAAAPGATARAVRRSNALPDLGGGPSGAGGLLVYAFATIVGLALLENALSGRGPAAVQTVLNSMGFGLRKLVDPHDPLIGRGTVTAASVGAGTVGSVAAGTASAAGGAAAAGALAGRYANPLAGLHVSLGRTDQGVDIEAGPAAVGRPIGAIGNAQIVAVDRNYQGFGQYVAYKLLDGPQAGQVIYVGHSRVANVKVGQRVGAGAPVAFIQGYNATPGHLEIGFANPRDPYVTAARAAGTVNPSSHYSPQGAAFALFLQSLLGGR